MAVSVVICVFTMRRWDDMLAAIGSVRAQGQPAHELIVVVDHNTELLGRLRAHLADEQADEQAAERASGSADQLPVKVVANEQPRGLSGGKNTGVRHATGDIVAFLDDDAVADSKWLKYLADNYSTPEVTGVGGLTLPNWDTGRPAWFPREFDWVVGCNYVGMAASRQPVRNLLGGNASFRRPVFDQVGGFAVDVGRSDKKLPLGGEETEFCIKLGQRLPEATLLIDDRAVIWHRVGAERTTLRYFLTRCYAEGISKAAVSGHVGSADGLSAERKQAFATLPAGIARNLAAPFSKHREARPADGSPQAALRRGDLSGTGRAAAIVAGLAAATAGYAMGRLTRR
ncbi:MAG TPA: glycosyltransferase family 2 protein [Streptosporangiaceae bacterium]